MAQIPAVRHRGRSARATHPTSKFTLAVAVCVLTVATGGTWSRQVHLFPDDGAVSDRYGNSVAISGNTIVVGAQEDVTAAGINAGSAYVFTRSGGTWIQQDHLFADDAVDFDQFGNSVAISGDTIVVGAENDDISAWSSPGSAYVFFESFLKIFIGEPDPPSGR